MKRKDFKKMVENAITALSKKDSRLSYFSALLSNGGSKRDAVYILSDFRSNFANDDDWLFVKTNEDMINEFSMYLARSLVYKTYKDL